MSYVPGSLLRERRRASPDEARARMDRAAAERLERFGADEGGLTEREQRELDGLRQRVAWLERRIGEES